MGQYCDPAAEKYNVTNKQKNHNKYAVYKEVINQALQSNFVLEKANCFGKGLVAFSNNTKLQRPRQIQYIEIVLVQY